MPPHEETKIMTKENNTKPESPTAAASEPQKNVLPLDALDDDDESSRHNDDDLVGNAYEEKVDTPTTTADETTPPASTTGSQPEEGMEEEEPNAAVGVGRRWGAFSKNMQQKWKALQEERQEKQQARAKEQQEKAEESATTATAIPQELTKADYQSMRASKISVTVVKESMDSKWGFGISMDNDAAQEQQPPKTENEKDAKVAISALSGDGLLAGAPIKEGDILLTVNNQKCVSGEATIQKLVSYEGGVPITLVCDVPGGNYSLVEAMVRKPTPESMVGIGFYNTEHEGGQTLLKINNLLSTGLLSHSVLSQGDLVLAINGTACHHMTADDAADLIKESDNTVSIIAMKPNAQDPNAQGGNRVQRMLKHAKRAGVAIGGGTMVGVGLVFIPTLPPPFGEVLIAGGVAVLGTEFEAPKRAMRNCRDSLEKAVGREGEEVKKAVEGEAGAAEQQQQQPESNDPNATTAETDETGTGKTKSVAEEPPKERYHRLKNFGRRHVLPFLDQVVGDKKEPQEKKENAVPATEQSTPLEIDETHKQDANETVGTEDNTPAAENSTDKTVKDDTKVEQGDEVVKVENNGETAPSQEDEAATRQS